jgi:hypothetical protein
METLNKLYVDWMNPLTLSLSKNIFLGRTDSRSDGSFDWSITNMEDSLVIFSGNENTAYAAKQRVWDWLDRLIGCRWQQANNDDGNLFLRFARGLLNRARRLTNEN